MTEFNDVEGREYGDPKKWPMFHTDDITCADVKLGEGVVTATYSGELIFWKLETGQPYRSYSVARPTEFIELKHNRDSDDDDTKEKDNRHHSNISVSRFVRKSISERIKEFNKNISRRITDYQPYYYDDDKHGTKTSARLPSLPMSVQALLFLQTRPMTKQHGR